MRQPMEAEPVPLSEPYENGLSQILVDVVEEVRLAIDRDVNGADLLYGLLSAPWLQSLLRVFECLMEHRTAAPSPYLVYASGVSQEVMASLRAVAAPSAEARELYTLLMDPHMQALLFTHDSVAQRDYEPVLPPLPDDLPDEEEAMRIVCLVKNNQPLGATIKRDEATGDIFIARVINGGLADRSGLLHVGDKLVEVNGKSVEGLQPEQVIQILVHSHGNILFKVIPNSPQPANNQSALYVRSMTDYNPQQDAASPCPDAGMAFRKGELLEIVDQRDINWWQARKLHSPSACAGLIPSTSLFKSKQRELWWSQPYQAHTCINPLSAADVGEEEKIEEENTGESVAEKEDIENEGVDIDGPTKGPYVAGFRYSLRVCRRMSRSERRQSCHSCGPGSCHNMPSNPYEEVVIYQRNTEDPPRLVALIGPSGVGLNELRKRLIKLNPSTFQGAVPHTTRPRRSNEQNGREYHFVTKELFKHMMCNHDFAECGKHNGHLYGTSFESIKDVIDSGKTCVIDIEPHCIPAVRTKKLKPYIIYVKPPSLERLRETRKDAKILMHNYSKRLFKIEDFEGMDQAGHVLEARYSQFVDCVLVNDALQDACMALLTVIQQAQEEPQWVPASWLTSNDP